MIDESVLKKTLKVELHIYQAIAIIGNLQLALRHPSNTGPTAAITRKFIAGLQERISKESAELNLIIEAGFNPDYDC